MAKIRKKKSSRIAVLMGSRTPSDLLFSLADHIGVFLSLTCHLATATSTMSPPPPYMFQVSSSCIIDNLDLFPGLGIPEDWNGRNITDHRILSLPVPAHTYVLL